MLLLELKRKKQMILSSIFLDQVNMIQAQKLSKVMCHLQLSQKTRKDTAILTKNRLATLVRAHIMNLRTTRLIQEGLPGRDLRQASQLSGAARGQTFGIRRILTRRDQHTIKERAHLNQVRARNSVKQSYLVIKAPKQLQDLGSI